VILQMKARHRRLQLLAVAAAANVWAEYRCLQGHHPPSRLLATLLRS